MTHAYDEVYVDDAQENLGFMYEFGVCELGYDTAVLSSCFIRSGIARRFGDGDPKYISGMSGSELARAVLEGAGIHTDQHKGYTGFRARSPEYWTGWALAYYQWHTGLGFADILRTVPIETIERLYYPYHEMDISKFVQRMDQIYLTARPDTSLKVMRTGLGISQRELSERSGVPVRTIQQYEQRQRDINRASMEQVRALAGAMHCRMEDLYDYVRPT